MIFPLLHGNYQGKFFPFRRTGRGPKGSLSGASALTLNHTCRKAVEAHDLTTGTTLEVHMEEMESDSLESGAAEEAENFSPCFGNAKEIVARYTHCAVCGANLHFTHITDFSRNLTQETARCPECGIKARRLTHRLQ